MLPVETLNKIVGHALAATDRQLATDTPSMLLPENYTVHNLEHLQAGRARFRGALSTESLVDFCKYVDLHTVAEEPSQAFIDADAMSCKAFFNLGNEDSPGHADNTATLSLKPTAAYQALRAIANRAHTQQDLAEWMEDWNTHLTVIGTNGEDIPVHVAVQKIRTITIKAASERTSSEQNFGAARSAMDSIEAAHAEQQPNDLLFKFAPYEGLKEQTFILRLSVITGDKPLLKPRWVQQEQQQEDIAQEFKQVLTREIGGLVELTIGTFTPGK